MFKKLSEHNVRFFCNGCCEVFLTPGIGVDDDIKYDDNNKLVDERIPEALRNAYNIAGDDMRYIALLDDKPYLLLCYEWGAAPGEDDGGESFDGTTPMMLDLCMRLWRDPRLFGCDIIFDDTGKSPFCLHEIYVGIHAEDVTSAEKVDKIASAMNEIIKEWLGSIEKKTAELYALLKGMSFEHFKSILFMRGKYAVEDFLGYGIPDREDKDVTDSRLNEAYAQMPEEDYLAFVKFYAPVLYFECSYDYPDVIEEARVANDQIILESSATQENICIRALRKPTVEEANAFLKNDIGEKKVWLVGKLNRSDAYDFYDMMRPTRLFGVDGEVWSDD